MQMTETLMPLELLMIIRQTRELSKDSQERARLLDFVDLLKYVKSLATMN